MSDIREEIKKRTAEIEAIIDGLLPEAEGFGKTVTEAMDYSVRVGGKRLRPMLMRELYIIFRDAGCECVSEEELHIFMAALECIHTYSLVHDDLPAMDDDLLRRGAPTTHAKYGEAMAILAGDGLLNYACELTSRAVAEAGDGSIRRLAVAERIIFERSGIEGMIGGQTADVEAEKKNLPSSAERLSYIHEKKTGALIAAAMLSGAILGGCGYDRLSGIEQMALALGLAFQIRDDILDVEGSEEVFGKPIGSDEKNAKLTYVSLYGLERAKAEVVRLTDEAHTLLDELPGDVGFLHGLFDVLIQRES